MIALADVRCRHGRLEQVECGRGLNRQSKFDSRTYDFIVEGQEAVLIPRDDGKEGLDSREDLSCQLPLTLPKSLRESI